MSTGAADPAAAEDERARMEKRRRLRSLLWRTDEIGDMYSDPGLPGVCNAFSRERSWPSSLSACPCSLSSREHDSPATSPTGTARVPAANLVAPRSLPASDSAGLRVILQGLGPSPAPLSPSEAASAPEGAARDEVLAAVMPLRGTGCLARPSPWLRRSTTFAERAVAWDVGLLCRARDIGVSGSPMDGSVVGGSFKGALERAIELGAGR